jgi:hypothetical protein
MQEFPSKEWQTTSPRTVCNTSCITLAWKLLTARTRQQSITYYMTWYELLPAVVCAPSLPGPMVLARGAAASATSLPRG